MGKKESFFASQDVIIVGSGLVGLWSALMIKKKHPKKKIVIVDKGIIPTGASTRNAGFSCFGSLSEVVYDGQTMGTDHMLELVEMRFKGLEKIQKYFKHKLIDFDLCGGYELYSSHDKIDVLQLEHNIEYINSLFKPITSTKKTYRLADELIDEFKFGQTKHLVKNYLEGYLHSGKLVQALLHLVQSMNVHVFTNTNILNYELTDDEVILNTNHHFKLCAKQLLICTNAFAKELLPEIDIVPARGQVLVTSPISGLPFKGTFHSDEGFYYFRNLNDRILLGGARNKAFGEETTTSIHTSDFIQKELEIYLDTVVLPGQKNNYTIDYRWAGIMAMGSEKMPIIKKITSNVFCAVRMSGMGVALAPVVGEKIAKLLYNNDDTIKVL